MFFSNLFPKRLPVDSSQKKNLWIRNRGSLGITSTFANYGAKGAQAYGYNIVQCPDNSSWKNISLGNGHVLALDANNSLWAWGSNYYGQVGISSYSTTKDYYAVTNEEFGNPNKIQGLYEVSGNPESYFAIKKDGSLWTWGSNYYEVSGAYGKTVDDSPVQIGSDYDWDYVVNDIIRDSELCAYTAAVKKDGSLWTWGGNQYLSLGHQDTGFMTTIYQATGGGGVPLFTKIENNNPSRSWTTVSSCYGNSSAIKSDGSLWTWGTNYYGNLGDEVSPFLENFSKNRSKPVQIGVDSWNACSSGGQRYLFNYTLAIKSDGSLWGWGGNGYGQAGLFAETNDEDVLERTKIGNDSWTQVFASIFTSYGIKKDGTLWSWGTNYDGVLGVGDVAGNSLDMNPSPLLVEPYPWAAASVGRSHSVAVGDDGSLWAWGNNSWGQLGQSDLIHRSSPVQIGTSGAAWYYISSFGDHNFAIKSDGSLWGWGWNGFGELGLSDAVTRSSPVQIGTSSWSFVSSGGNHTLAIKSDGTLWAWGFNFNGQLGQGDTIHRSSPVQIGTSSWTSVSAGNNFVVAIKPDGSLWTWGRNYEGQLGQGNTTNYSSPVQVGTSSWTSVDAGYNHAAAVQSTDRTVWMWGNNSHGQLGQGDINHRSSPVIVGGLLGRPSTNPDISCGKSYTHVVLQNPTFKIKPTGRDTGYLYSWGYNGNGQLGLGDYIHRSLPVQVGSFPDYNANHDTTFYLAYAGYYHSIGYSDNAKANIISTSSSLYLWGDNSGGQLGQNDRVNREKPSLLITKKWQQVAGGRYIASAIATDGTLWMWGNDTAFLLPFGTSNYLASPIVIPKQVGTDTNWKQVSPGGYHVAAIKTNGTLWTWGGNYYGELGLGNGIYDYNYTDPVTSPNQVGTDTDWNFVVSGNYFSAALKNDGSLWGWGSDEHGQFGLNDGPVNLYHSLNRRETAYTKPIRIGPQDKSWAFVAASGMGAFSREDSKIFAVDTKGDLWCAGFNSYGELGLGQDKSVLSPKKVDNSSWSLVKSGKAQMVGIKTDGSLWTWGTNFYGNLGHGDFKNSLVPKQVSNYTDWIDATVRQYDASHAIRSDGSLWVWGAGHNHYRLNRFSKKIDSYDNPATWNSVSIGALHQIAIKTDGSLWAWGWNSNGQLGLGDTNHRLSPIQIGTSSWTSVAAGYNFTVALKSNNTLWVWGKNNIGQLGQGDLIHRSSPVQIGTSSWTSVDVGSQYSIAIKSNGTIWAWGDNSYGQLGLADVFHRSSPVQVGISSWSLVTCNTSTTAAIKTDGTLWMWGNNYYGQIGQGTRSRAAGFSSPVVISSLTTWQKISNNANHSFAIKSDGSMWAWGQNYYGQLGQSDRINRSSPVQIGTSSWIAIDGNGSTNLAIRFDNTLWAWGSNIDGELGQGDKIHRSSPVQIGTSSWTSVSVGGGAFQQSISTYAAIKPDGTLWMWGGNTYGKLGQGDKIHRSSPVQVGSDSWSLVSVGNNHVTAIRSNGSMWAWGWNSSQGELGLGNQVSRSSPVQIGSSSWDFVSTGYRHTLAIRSDKTLWSWGFNIRGQLGQGDTNALNAPTLVSGESWVSVTAGREESLGIKTNGTLWVWGSNSAGQLGQNDAIYRSSPVQVGGSWSAGGISATNSIAIKTDGTLWAWGSFSDGRSAGWQYNYDISTPTQIGSSSWTSVSIGNKHTMAIKPDGSLWAWGFNNQYQFGRGDTTNSFSPIQVGSSSWSAVFAGDTNTMLIKPDGTLWETGTVLSGFLSKGDGTSYTYRSMPSITQTGGTIWNTCNIGYTAGAFRQDNSTLWVWGDNSYGQLGLGDRNHRSSPVILNSFVSNTEDAQWMPKNIKRTAGGNYLIISSDFKTTNTIIGDTFSLAIKTNASLFAWGDNSDGQLGLGDRIHRLSPVQVSTVEWSSVSGSFKNAAAIYSNQIFTWGNNIFGQLGQGDTLSRSTPAAVSFSPESWIQVNTGYTTAGIRIESLNPKLYLWGRNTHGQLGQGNTEHRSSPVQLGTNDWKRVALSDGQYVLAIRASDNTLWAWGNNNSGQLGQGDLIHRSSPVQVGVVWKEISAGYSHNVAVKTDGSIWTWGNNDWGQLGQSDLISRSSPIQIGTSSWSSVSAGGFISFAIRSDGSLWSWGRNQFGQLGQGDIIHRSSPIQIGTSSWSSVSAGWRWAAAIKTDGTLWTWGSNSYAGQLGQGDLTNRSSPVQVGGSWSSVSAGTIHCLAIKNDKTLWSWGDNISGQLGQGDTIHRSSPVQVSIGSLWNSVSGSNADLKFNLAIKDDGTLWAWGQGFWGSLGQGDIIDRSTPIQVASQFSWKKCSAGFGALAIRSDDTLWAWGYNFNGGLGLGDKIGRSSPVQVGTSSWISVSAGYDVAAIKTDGTLWMWGENFQGELGQGDLISRSSPVQVGSENNTWLDVSAQGSHVVAIKYDSSLWAWGLNTSGQLGQNTLTHRSSPVQIGTSSWSLVSAGRKNTIALKVDGTMWSWGDNSRGALGQGNTTNYSSPVQVGTDNNSEWSKVTNIKYDSCSPYNFFEQTESQRILMSLYSKKQPYLSFNSNPAQLDIRNHSIAPINQFAIKNNGSLYQRYLSSYFKINALKNITKLETGQSWTAIYNSPDTTLGYNASYLKSLDNRLWRFNPVARVSEDSFDITLAGQGKSWNIVSSFDSALYAIDYSGNLWSFGLINKGSGLNDNFGTETFITDNVVKFVGKYILKTDNKIYPISSGGPYPLAATDRKSILYDNYDILTRWTNNISQKSYVTNLKKITNFSWSIISAEKNSSYAIKTDGSLWSWGQNNRGQLGQGDLINRSSPVIIPSGVNWKSISAGGLSLGIKYDGTLWSWGNNNNSKLGQGDTIHRSSPVQVGSNSWSVVSAGVSHGGAISASGVLHLWGDNSAGQLSTGDTSNRSVPTPVYTVENLWNKVSSGTNHAAAIKKSDNSLWTWGLNSDGQLGQSTFAHRSSPVQIGTSSWTSVSASSSGSHTLAIKVDGSLWAWGLNTSGQLGQGNLSLRTSPVQVGASSWTSVSTGINYTVAIKSDGSLWAWGSNYEGNLGLGYSSGGAFNAQTSFIQISGSNWQKISAGVSFAVAIKTDGSLWSWGLNTYGQLGQGNRISRSSPVQIGTSSWITLAAGDVHVAAIRSDGSLWSWGLNQFGQLGQDTQTHRSVPVQVGTSSWTSVDAGRVQTTAIRSDGTLWAWGGNYNGLLGQGDKINRSSPVQIGTSSWIQVSSGDNHNQAIRLDNTLWAWGLNSSGQLGQNTIFSYSSPVQIGTSSWTSVSVGGWGLTSGFTVAIKSDGTLWSWGHNSLGTLGQNDRIHRSSPVQIGTSSWSSVSTARSHVAAIGSDGSLWTWGYNLGGALGQSNQVHRSSPVQLGSDSWSVVSTGVNFTVAIKPNGTLWAAGASGGGALANAEFIYDKVSPVQIGTSSWNSVSAGNIHTLAIKADGTLWAWGRNINGQLGQSDLNHRSSPVQIGTSSWTSVSAGNNHSLAIRSDNSLWAWGINQFGQLGQNDQINRSSPVQIGTSSWTSVSAGRSYSMAIRSDNSLWAWGNNVVSKLGLSDVIHRSSPVQIGTSSWTFVSVGNYTSLAIRSDGSLWGWGNNFNGQLGLGNRVDQSSPVVIGTGFWTKLVCGDKKTLGLISNVRLYVCGENTSGELGLGDRTSRSNLTALDSTFNYSYGSFGFKSSYFIKSDGSLWATGLNSTGELGQSDRIHRSSPVQIGTSSWTFVSGGYKSAYGIKKDGTLWSWGDNSQGQLGLSTRVHRSSPVQIGTGRSWVFVSSHTNAKSVIFIDNNNNTWVCGDNTDGQLGLTDRIHRSALVQVGSNLSAFQGQNYQLRQNLYSDLYASGYNLNGELGLGDNVHRSSPSVVGTISSNNWNIISDRSGVQTDGSLWTWGSNAYGELGRNDLIHRNYLSKLDTSSWSFVSSYANTTLAIKVDGTLWAWGRNINGQLGQGNQIHRSSPVQIGLVWSKLSAGGYHTLGIRSNGTLWAWGWNTYGQLGQGNLVHRSSPIQVGALSNWSGVFAGYEHSSAIKSDGTLWAWGKNTYGTLGQGDNVNRSLPVQIGTDTNWSFVSSPPLSQDISIALKTDGSLWAWGSGFTGSLGLGDFNSRSSPTQVGTSSWSYVSASYQHTLAIKSDGTLWSWGNNTHGQLGLGDNISNESPVQIGTSSWSLVAAGYRNSHGIKSDKSLWSWGINNGGSLGLGDTISRSSPVQVGTSSWVFVECSGFGSTLAIRLDNTLWAWGTNFGPELGQGNTTKRSSPVQIGAGSSWNSVTVGASHVVAEKSNRTLWAWGGNWTGQLGLGSISNVEASIRQVEYGINIWSSVRVTSSFHCHGIKSDGTLWAWGSNELFPESQIVNNTEHTRKYNTTWGGLGQGVATITSLTRSILSPTIIAARNSSTLYWVLVDQVGAVAPAPGTFAIKSDGSLWSWGYGNYGQLGQNDLNYRGSPVQIGSSSWSYVSAHGKGAYAIRSDGTLWAWGRNIIGELGQGNLVDRSSPVQIGTSSWIFVDAGLDSVAAIKIDGTLWSWGDNYRGQLGHGDRIHRSSPVQIGTSSWTTVSISQFDASYAIKLDRTLWAWGYNNSGQLGQGDLIHRSSPVQIGTSSWTSVSSGGYHALAIKSDGSLWAWGGNSRGELGQSNLIPRSSPVQIGTQSWITVNASADLFSTAIRSNGSYWVWGNNDFGQLGQGSRDHRSSPVQVGALNLSTTGTNIGAFGYAYEYKPNLWKTNSINSRRKNQLLIDDSGNIYLLGQTYIPIGYDAYSPVQVGTANNWGTLYKNSIVKANDGKFYKIENEVIPLNDYTNVGISTYSDVSQGHPGSIGFI